MQRRLLKNFWDIDGLRDRLSAIGDVIEQEGLPNGAVPSDIFEEIDTAIELTHKYNKEIDICIIISSRYGLVSSPPFYELTRDKSYLYFGELSLGEFSLGEECYAIYVRTQNQLKKYLKGIEEFYKNKYNTQILSDNVIHISW